MPPVRWKLFYVSTITLLQLLTITDGQRMQDAISMSADGWRPIIGSRRQPSEFEADIKTPEITHYRNPSQTIEVDIVKADSPAVPPSTVAPNKVPHKVSTADTVNNNINGGNFQKQGGKIPPHSKFTSPGPYHTIPTSAHGPLIPIGPNHSRPGQFGQKRPQLQPTAPYFGQNPKRKPVRVQATAHSNREEVFARPPTSASFPFTKQAQSNVKTRETQGLGIPGVNHFSLNQPSTHLDFTNRFALIPQSNDNFQQFKSHPVTTFIFTKPPTQANDNRYQFKSQNDEYTRNLVPPPLSRFEQEKEKSKATQATSSDNVVAVTEPFIKSIQFGDFSAHQFGLKPPKQQENLVPQLTPQFEQNFSFQKQFSKPKEQAIDVQVTKEKLKVFHNGNIPSNYNPSNDYIDYDYHSVKRPSDLPKLQTYEVTEGKWVDSPNPYTFTYPSESQQILPQRLIRLPTARPQLAESVVELSLPPFLPTPYKPPGVVPTSPTQSEAATVFSKISTKMNRFKNEALTTHPLFFDVKEVSTHYPILGMPGPIQDSSTNNLMQLEEISNEITSTKQAIEEVEPTMIPTTTRAPQRTKARRRKPQPRRPASTTTTTEEPAATASYELQKTQEVYEEMPVETERPLRRPRPRPNRFRTSSSAESEESRPSRYRTTTPASESEESTEKRVRGRHRYRQRGNGSKNEIRNSPARKRIRPTTTEAPSNHKTMDDEMMMTSDEATEPVTEHVHSAERETQGIFETKYPQKSFQGVAADEEFTTKSSRLEYESPERHHEPTQYEQESKYETTIVSNNEVSSVQKPSFDGEDDVVTERTQDYGRTRSSVGTTVLQDITTNIHLPENEIDYSTSAPTPEQDEERVETTLATTLPTTTTEATTTKSHRIRGRPTKYDSSSRPRFSVKDYRQRFNQYTSTTPSTTTDFMKTTEGIRLRFPSRLRTRPTPKTTTQSSSQTEEDQTEPVIRRGGFKPKEPRHSVTTTDNPQENIITEKNVKSVNTRLRPFGRFRSTTESSSVATAKVSIKPNLFSARKRPPQLSLRNRVYGKLNKNATEETTTYGNDAEVTETSSAQTTAAEDGTGETTTEFHPNMKLMVETTTEIGELTTTDVNEDDYSQRVSELTSSFKNEYETPGFFKSVSPTSRRIPSYFTISTDDPILPIEAFFPNIKDKDKEQ